MEYFRQTYLVKFWNPLPAVIALGILSTYYFGLSGSLWAVTGEFTRWGGHILQFFGVDISRFGYYKIQNMSGTPLTRNDGIMVIGMFLGCLIASLWANNFKLRFPTSPIRIAQALIGGIISGFGARLAMGCNLANFFTGIPYFSLHTWVFTICMIVGVYFGTKVVKLPCFLPKATPFKVDSQKSIVSNKKRGKILFTLGCIVFLLSLAWMIYLTYTSPIPKNKTMPILGMALGFGISFGFIVARAQICFTSAFRDLFIMGRSQMAKAVIAGMAVSSIGVFSYVMLGTELKLSWMGPNIILGGLLFGFGIVLAGGCECGWMYRAVEGQVHYWIVGVGNIIGTMLLAFSWDYYGEALATSWPKINLLEVFGNHGGLIVNYVLLFLSFLVILWLQKRFFAIKARNSQRIDNAK
ncbi:selenium metabolism membrane protein YedE/FdhT [Helicobacter cappadocius]|uniref:Selenium metabolism membrane protein YedE/FdhT n=1 Tax=Helicobacter cappadocius TaxID=3063998 RepID=A0AA90PUE6_9HELI|nr:MULTISPECIES: selenium metabolism membrane protein YedE/FdhT [unclassified Helicobacter]MDO7253840.1 selenium metabolism membrane protein YedE/FdhT [Helicobacter sp. faydin-H75]MDP2539729.1 selenium metabolism membrane protein YedE/FdhT [Helicobacter sp. faydin-H76]